MTNDPRPFPAMIASTIPDSATLDIETFSYEERRVVFPAITHVLDMCGCWLLDRRPLSFTQIEFLFELPMVGVVDLYAALIAAGLELTRASHDELTLFCILRKHQHYPSAHPSVVTVRLEVSFIEEGSLEPVLAAGSTYA